MTPVQSPTQDKLGAHSREVQIPLDRHLPSDERQNVGSGERSASVVGGAILTVLGISRRSASGIVCAGTGVALLCRGISGHCPLYARLGLDTVNDRWTTARHVQRPRRLYRMMNPLLAR
jgi:uncharacterized membrane protein